MIGRWLGWFMIGRGKVGFLVFACGVPWLTWRCRSAAAEAAEDDGLAYGE